jgi:uncharacterized protein YajQ (UPF0234 family)
MAQDHSFDIVCELEKPEVTNAITQTEREVSQRYDFKGAKVNLEFDAKAMTIVLTADSDFRLKALSDVLDGRLAKRQIPLAAIGKDKIETSSGGHARQCYHLQTGIPTDKAKEIIKIIKGLKSKVQAAIQGDQVRVSGKSLDDLQTVQKAIKEAELDFHIQYVNYR